MTFMENVNYEGAEHRKFIRLEFITPITCKVCKQETITKLFNGYSVNISEAGILCKIKETVSVGDILWLSFDKTTLTICENVEKRCFIYQSGIIGKVVRTHVFENNLYSVAVQFFTREEMPAPAFYMQIDSLQTPV